MKNGWSRAVGARRSWPRLAVIMGLCAATGPVLTLAACSGSREVPTPGVSMRAPSVKAPPSYTQPRAAGVRNASSTGGYKLGKPYRVGNVWYVPREEPGYDVSGTGSWYGADFHGRSTANGETYDMNALTAAHPTLPLPSYLYVTNVADDRTIMVRVNDRGPYVPGRIIDLSLASARALGYEHLGTARLRVRYAGRAPLNGDDSREREFLAQQPWHSREVASAQPSRPGGILRLQGPKPPDDEPAPLVNPSWSTGQYRRSLLGEDTSRPNEGVDVWSTSPARGAR